MTDGDKGLNREGSTQAMDSIKQGVSQFRRRLDANVMIAINSLPPMLLIFEIIECINSL